MLQSKFFSFSEEPPTNEKASTVCKKDLENLIVQCNLSLLATPTHPKGLVIYVIESPKKGTNSKNII